MDGCPLSSVRDLSHPSVLLVQPLRNEITWWWRETDTERLIQHRSFTLRMSQSLLSKKSTPAEEHMFLFSLQQSSHFRHRYYLFLEIPFPVSALLTWSSESPESGSYLFLLLFALKTSLEALCACVFVLFLLLVFFFLFFSRLICTQRQQRNQKQEDCGMQNCQCARQLGYCYQWNTSSLVRKRKYQVLKGRLYSFQRSWPDRFFPLRKVYLFVRSYRPVQLEGTSWVSKPYLFSLLISSMSWQGLVGKEISCLCGFTPITLTGSYSGPSSQSSFHRPVFAEIQVMPFVVPVPSFTLNRFFLPICSPKVII